MHSALTNDCFRIYSDEIIISAPDLLFAENLLDYHLRNKKHFEPWIPLTEPEFYSLKAQHSLLEKQLELQNENRLLKFYIFNIDEPEKIISDISFSNIITGSFMACHMGYKTDEELCGKGITTKAIALCVDYVFKSLKLNRIEANVMPKNKASIRVLEKCGFLEEGYAQKYLKINGKWEDHIRYYLLNPASK